MKTRFVNDELRELYQINREMYEAFQRQPEVEYLTSEEVRELLREGGPCRVRC